MFWFALTYLVAFLCHLITVPRHTDGDKDLQILLLRHQLRLLQRQRPQPRLTRWEKRTLVVLTAKLQHRGTASWAGLDHVILRSSPRPCCAGTASWSAASGPSVDHAPVADQPSLPRSRT